MERKENDLFMTMLASPQANFNDLVVGGLNVDNTSLQDREIYKNNDKVRLAYQNEDGTFNDDAFNSAYNYVLSTYNNLSSTSVDKALEDQLTFHRSNPFAPVEKRRQGPEFQEYKMANPYEQVFNMVELGRVEAPTKSVDELAQSHSVLLNPTTAGDNLENAQWGDSPNGNLGKYFWDTLVLAQYDEDGQHYDPFTGQMVSHNKGDLKLNNDGEFYYEKLDGRGVVGKKVLNKMNILTTDGSNLNRYDFFDSDDLTPKSFGGNLMKNLALVGSMFLPGVGPWITGLSVATQAAGFLSALGNMATATQGGVLSEIEGFAKSWDRGTLKTEYAQQNPWCVESFIDMIAEFLAFTREQRIIFEKVPQLIKGLSIATKAQQDAKYAELKNLTDKANLARFDMAMKDPTFANNIEKVAKARWELNQISAFQAQSQLESYIKGYQNLGELLSRAYLVGNGAANTYEEALNQGADEIDATILTLGHAAAEYAFLSTGIGKWLFPELRQDTYRNQAIAKALTTAKKEGQAQSQSVWKALKSFDKENKKAYFTNLFNLGKGIATAEYSNGQKTLITTLATSAGGAVEMLGFDVLRDLSNSCYNLVKWLNGDEHRMSAFAYNADTGEYDRAGLISRYGLSFLTGWIGGAASNFVHNFNMIKDLEKMTSKQAMLEVIYMIRNGQADRFIKDINKMTLADPHLSATESEFINGEEVFKPGMETDNQDLAVKNAIKTNIDIIKDILEAEGANLSDDSFLDRQTLSDLRFIALKDTLTADAFLNEFNDLSSELTEFTFKINKVYESALDTNNDGTISDPESRRGRTKEEIKKLLSDEQRKELDRLEDQRSEVRKKLKGLIDGERSMEFVQKALFEASKALSGELTEITFNDYVRNHYGRPYDVLSEVEKKDAVTKYAEWLKTAGREKVGTISDVFYSYDVNTSDVIKNHGKRMLEQSELTRGIDEMIAKTYELLNPEYFDNDELWLDLISDKESLFGPHKATQNLRDYISRQLLTDSEKGELSVIENQAKETYQLFNNEQAKLQQAREDNNEDAIKEAQNNISQYLKLLVDISNDYEMRNIGALRNHFNELYNALEKRGYANEETKENIINVLTNISKLVREHIVKLNQLGNVDDLRTKHYEDLYYEIVGKNEFSDEKDESGNNIVIHNDGLVDKIGKLDDSPFFKNINEFALIIGTEIKNVSELEKELNKAYRDNIDDLSKFAIEPDVQKALANALTTIKIYRAAIMAARTDNAGWNDYFGYNATLNEISRKRGASKPELAEIDSLAADALVVDIDTVYNKLKYLASLLEINQGQKMSLQNRVATQIAKRKYQGLKRFLNIPNNSPLRSWNSFDDFINNIRSANLHEQILNENKTNLSTDDQKTLEQERISMEDGIYAFIQGNMDKINDPNKILELVNTDNFNLFTTGDGLLSENMESIDDAAFLYYICSRGAIKASDFYRSYAEEITLDEEKQIAPIPAQEEHIYLAFSSIMNSPIFDAFYKAARKSMTESWGTFDQEKRAEILKLLKTEPNFSSKDFDNLCSFFLPLPTFSSTTFIEGIAGAGKTNGCGPILIKLINKHAPDLLKNIVIINGADGDLPTKAKELAASLGLDSAKCYTVLDFLKRITGDNYKVPEFQNGTYLYDNTDFSLANDNDIKEMKSTIGLVNDSNPPKLILIDEISRLDQIQYDIIDRYALNYGIRNVVFGDTDQLGVYGELPVNNEEMQNIWNKNGLKLEGIYANLNRSNFIRFQKLGISMRTLNALMTQAQNELQATIHTNQKEIKFDYYVGDENSKYPGLHGVKTYNIDRDEEDGDVIENEGSFLNDVKLILKDANARGVKKIGYIGSPDSSVYKILIKNFGNDAIDPFFGGREQGEEGLYFVVDPGFIKDSDEYLKKIYTGITRAKQGVILVNPYDAFLKTSSRKLESNIPESSSQTTLRRYSEGRKKILLEILPNAASIKYTKPVIKKDSLVVDKSKANPPQEAETAPGKDSEKVDVHELLKDSLDDSGDNLNNDIELADNPTGLSEDGTIVVGDALGHADDFDAVITASATDDPVKTAIDENSGRINGLLWGTFAKQTSLIVDGNGKIHLPDDDNDGLVHVNTNIPVKYWTRRNDNLIGIVKMRENANGDISKDAGAIKRVEDHVDKMSTAQMDKETDVLGQIKDIVYFEKEKSAMIAKINRILQTQKLIAKPQNTYVTFAIKTQSRISSKNRDDGYLVQDAIPTYAEKKVGQSRGWPSRFSTSLDEQIIHLGKPKQDKESLETLKKSLIAIIGTTYIDANGDVQHGDVLEFPLLNFSSFLTLMKVPKKDGNGLYFQDFYNDFNNMDGNIHEKILELINRYGNDPYYEDLVTAAKFFDVSNNGILFIKDPNWTLGKNLRDCGPQYKLYRGKLSEDGKYDFNANYISGDELFGGVKWRESDWTTVLELSKDPFVKMTDNIYIAASDEYNDGVKKAKGIFKYPGVPFVLISNKKEGMVTDDNIISRYVDQSIDPSTEKNVLLIYVLPPKASFSDYIDNLVKIKITGEADYDSIGLLYTPFKILERLIKYGDDDFKNIFRNSNRLSKEIYDPDGDDGKGSGLLVNLINRISDAYQNGKGKEGKGREDVLKILFECQDWSKYGIGKKETKNHPRNCGLLELALLHMCHDYKKEKNVETNQKFTATKDSNAINIMAQNLEKDITSKSGEILEKGINGIYYSIRTEKGATAKKVMGLDVAVGVSNYQLLTSKGNLDFKLHGKYENIVKQDLISSEKEDRGQIIQYMDEFCNPKVRKTDESKYRNYNSEIDAKIVKPQEDVKTDKQDNKNDEAEKKDDKKKDKKEDKNANHKNDKEKDEVQDLLNSLDLSNLLLNKKDFEFKYNTKDDLKKAIINRITNEPNNFTAMFFGDKLYYYAINDNSDENKNLQLLIIISDENLKPTKVYDLSKLDWGNSDQIKLTGFDNFSNRTFEVYVNKNNENDITGFKLIEINKSLASIASYLNETGKGFKPILEQIKKEINNRPIISDDTKNKIMKRIDDNMNISNIEDFIKLVEYGPISRSVEKLSKEDIEDKELQSAIKNLHEYLKADKTPCEIDFTN